MAAFWGAGYAQLCELPEDAEIIDIADFGTLQIGNFDTEADLILLKDGVCIEGETGWRLFTREASVLVEAGPVNEATGETETLYKVEAGAVTLQLGELTLTASSLLATQGVLRLPGLRFRTEDFVGSAQEGRYNLETGITFLLSPRVRGRSFQLSSSAATLKGDLLSFERAEATTCDCPGEPPYVVSAETASYEVDAGRLQLSGGQLELGGLALSLGDLTISEESFSDIAFPFSVEYVGDNGDGSGTGLGVTVKPFEVAEDLRFELGLRGLDSDYPLGGVFLTRYQPPGLALTFGLAPRGFQADFVVTEAVAPWLDASFAVLNRPWEAADFLHEGALGLDADVSLPVPGQSSLSFGANALMAASSQTFGGEVVSGARLSLGLSLAYRTPLPVGDFSLGVDAQNTYYPLHARNQYGFTLRPAYRYSRAGLGVATSYTWRFTNGASPFSGKLDRLSPQGALSTTAEYKTDVGGTALEVSGLFRYDFVEADDTDLPGLERLEGRLLLRRPLGGLTIRPYFSFDAARLLNPALSSDRRAELGLGLDLSAESWEAGLGVAVEPPSFGLSSVVASASFPLSFETFSLQPYVALDFVPLINGEWPAVTGHGVELTLPSCCGTLVAGYRQTGNRFTTSFALRFEDFTLGEE